MSYLDTIKSLGNICMAQKWKHFEEATFKVVKQLNPKSSVYHNVEITGKLSKTSRQVDVQLVDPKEYDFVAFECKDYKVPVDIPRIEAFASKLKDLGTPKGAIVSNSGYSKPAITLAKEWGIDLLNLVNTEDPLIRFRLHLNGIFHGIHIKTFTTEMSSSSSVPFLLSQEVSMTKLMNEQGDTIPAYDLFSHLWNDTKTPFSRSPGCYKYTYENPCIVRLVDLKNQIVPLDSFAFIYQVEKDSFFGQIKIINTSGLYNVHKQTYATKSFSTENIVPTEITKNWKHIDNEEQLKDYEKQSQVMLEAIAQMPKTYPFKSKS